MMASNKGHVKVVEKLLEHGAKLENITKVRSYILYIPLVVLAMVQP